MRPPEPYLRVTQRAVAWQRATDASTAVAIAVVDFLYGPFARIPTAFASRPDDQVLLAVLRPSHWSDVNG